MPTISGEEDRPKRHEAKHGKYAPHSLPKEEENLKSCVTGRERRKLAAAAPDSQAPDLTGRYQDEKGFFTLAINQAGDRIEGWMGNRQDARNNGTKREIILLGGDRINSTTFSYYIFLSGGVITIKDKADGTIEAKGNKIILTGLLENTLVLNAKRPTLSRAAISALPVDNEIFRLNEWFPLTRQEIDFLKAALSLKNLKPKLKHYFDAGDGEKVGDRNERMERARLVDNVIGKAFSDPNKKHGWYEGDMPLVDFHSIRILTIQRLTHGKRNRTLLSWLQVIVDRTAKDIFPNLEGKKKPVSSVLPETIEHLALRDSNNPEDKFLYEVTIRVVGFSGDVGIGVGGFIGLISIAQFDKAFKEKAPTAGPRWSRDFNIWMIELSGGWSVGVKLGFQTSGQGVSSFDYQPENLVSSGLFTGWFHLFDDSSVLGPVNVSKTRMILDGDGTLPKLHIDLSGVMFKLGAGLGGETGGAFGQIVSFAFSPKPDKDFSGKQFDYAREVQFKAKTNIHFACGDAFLTDEARQILRIFCAEELFSFNSALSRLTIVGHADRTDTEERNLELSELRAKNTELAIRDILGNNLKILNGRIKSIGLGEEEHAKVKPNSPEAVDPSFRKVDIILNSRLSVTLQGE